MPVRVVYVFDVPRDNHSAFHEAWRDVVHAHRRAGHGALESTLLADPERPDTLVAISRWASREDWSRDQNDAVDLQAYTRLRSLGELVDKTVLEEMEVLG